MTTVDLPATLLVAAPEDAGAQTLDRYVWQASMAVVDLFALAIAEWGRDGEARFAVVCEHHEDYVVVSSSGTTLVSVKHRERTRGGWTLASLVVDGGVAHLFDRWRKLDMSFGCRLVTCSGMASAGGKFAALLLAVHEGADLSVDHRVVLSSFAVKLAATCAATDEDRAVWFVAGQEEPSDVLLQLCVRFLKVFRLDSGRSDREELPYSAIGKYATPFTTFLDLPEHHAATVWERCNEQVLTCMRARGELEHGGIEQVVGLYRDAATATALASALQNRVFTSENLREVVDLCVSLELESTTFVDFPAPTVLSAKVINGGLTMTTAQWAEDLAQAWRVFEASAEEGGPGAYTQISSLRAWVQGRTSEASEEATTTGVVDGRIMWARLRQLLKEVPEELSSSLVTESILLGAACVLASECKVWFSPLFPIKDAVAIFPKRLDGTAA